MNITTIDALRIARSFGLHPTATEVATDVARANELAKQPLPFEALSRMRASATDRRDFAGTIAHGRYDPAELMACWYQETAREMAAESAQANRDYYAMYGPND